MTRTSGRVGSPKAQTAVPDGRTQTEVTTFEWADIRSPGTRNESTGSPTAG